MCLSSADMPSCTACHVFKRHGPLTDAPPSNSALFAVYLCLYHVKWGTDNLQKPIHDTHMLCLAILSLRQCPVASWTCMSPTGVCKDKLDLFYRRLQKPACSYTS